MPVTPTKRGRHAAGEREPPRRRASGGPDSVYKGELEGLLQATLAGQGGAYLKRCRLHFQGQLVAPEIFQSDHAWRLAAASLGCLTGVCVYAKVAKMAHSKTGAFCYYLERAPWESIARFAELQGPLINCEFACWCADFVKRYLSGDNANALKGVILSYLRHKIEAIHIGPTYSDGVAERDRKRFREPSHPIARVFSLDVDLTDYDHLDIDATDQDACDAAWPMSAIAVTILRHLLHDAFGFKHMLTVFSGRRGVHVHVLDASAIRMDDEARKAVISNLNFSPHKKHARRANDQLVHYVNGRPGLWLNLERLFVDIALDPDGLNLLGFDHQREAFVDTLNLYGQTFLELKPTIMAAHSGREAYLSALTFLKPHFSQQWVRNVFRATVIGMIWPRIDVGVGTLNHTIRCPFSVHDKANRLATPVRTDSEGDVFKFHPSRAPYINPTTGDIAKECIPWFREAVAVFDKTIASAVQTAPIVSRSKLLDVEDLV